MRVEIVEPRVVARRVGAAPYTTKKVLHPRQRLVELMLKTWSESAHRPRLACSAQCSGDESIG